jgi:hypothetical protein
LPDADPEYDGRETEAPRTCQGVVFGPGRSGLATGWSRCRLRVTIGFSLTKAKALKFPDRKSHHLSVAASPVVPIRW